MPYIPVTPIDYAQVTNNLIPTTQEFGIVHNTKIFSSSLTGATQTLSIPGAKWRTTLAWEGLEPEEAGYLKAFLAQLRGSAGRFYIHDYSWQRESIDFGGSLDIDQVDSARQIRISSLLEPFQPGDYIQVGSGADRELKMIVDVINPTTGVYTIEPELRKYQDTSYDYVGDAVNTSSPSTMFMLVDDQQAVWSAYSKALLTDFSIDAIGVFSA